MSSSHVIKALIVWISLSSNSALGADPCNEATEAALLAGKLGNPNAAISSINRAEKLCKSEFDPAWGASVIAGSYITSKNYGKALEYANKCLNYNYAEALCHLAKIKALEHIPRVKDFNEQRALALAACLEINRNTRENLKITEEDLKKIELGYRIEVTQVCIDSVMQIKPR